MRNSRQYNMHVQKQPRAGWLVLLFALLCAALLCVGCSSENAGAKKASTKPQNVTAVSYMGQPMPDLAALAEQKNLTEIDLRGHVISREEIETLQQALPKCKILYSIMLGGNAYACTAETLRIKTMTEADFSELQYFESLKVLDARGSSCIEALEEYAKAHPEVYVRWTVPVASKKVENDTAWLDLNLQELPETETLIEQLGQLPYLTDVSLVGCALSLEDKALLLKSCPEIRFYWTVDISGKQFKNTETRLDFNGVNFNGAEHLARVVACFQDPQWVDVATHGFESAEMIELCEQFPNTEFVWTVRVGKHTLRTDIEVFNGKSSGGDRLLRNDDIKALKYCKNLRAVNLYRNSLSDLSPLAELENLEVLILSNNKIRDLSPLSNLKNLKYLEAHNNYIEDVSPIADLPQLYDLNLMFNNIRDFKAVEKMTELQRGYFSRNEGLEADTWQSALRIALPNAELDFDDANVRGWQNHDRYDLLDRIWTSTHMEALY